jgi:hypothetical protein
VYGGSSGRAGGSGRGGGDGNCESSAGKIKVVRGLKCSS